MTAFVSLGQFALQDCHQSAVHQTECFIARPTRDVSPHDEHADAEDFVRVYVTVLEVSCRPIVLLAHFSRFFSAFRRC